MFCSLNTILNSIYTAEVIFNIRDINIGLFVLFCIIYYLLPGVLYYLYFYKLCAKSKKKEKWYVYLFFYSIISENLAWRLGFAVAAALLTIEILGAYTPPMG